MGMRCQLYATSEAQAKRVLADPEELVNVPGPRSGSQSSLRLEKSWHGLHYILTGTAWEGTEPLCFLLAGGETVGDEVDPENFEDDDTPARVLLPKFVRKLHKALAKITLEEFGRRFDLEKLAEADLYPHIWESPEDDLRSEYQMYFQSLKKFVERAAEREEAIVVLLG